jgi:hypothetical protein
MVTGFKKVRLLLAGVIIALGGALPVTAGTGPGHLGLPAATAYGNQYQNNEMSAMCVDCHTGNPSARTAEKVGPPLVNDPAFPGTHFTYRAGKPTNNVSWEKLDRWGTDTTNPNYSYGFSKYGSLGTGTSVTGVAGEMICESCHNIVLNVPGSTPIPQGKGNKKLLAWDAEETTTGILCEGCHGPSAGFDPAKFQHRTGDVKSTTGAVLSTDPETSFTRSAPLTGSGVTYPAVDAVSCRSCHVAHDGIKAAGARVLKRGYSKAPSTSGGPVLGASTTGLDRQYDIDSSVPPASKLVTDSTPLCDSCHKMND